MTSVQWSKPRRTNVGKTSVSGFRDMSAYFYSNILQRNKYAPKNVFFQRSTIKIIRDRSDYNRVTYCLQCIFASILTVAFPSNNQTSCNIVISVLSSTHICLYSNTCFFTFHLDVFFTCHEKHSMCDANHICREKNTATAHICHFLFDALNEWIESKNCGTRCLH